jgi:serine/threonine-protein kinase
MALQLDDLGRPAEAREQFVAALDIMTEVYGPEHLQTATLLLNLGSLERRLNRYDDALVHLEKGTAIHDKVVAPDDPRRAFDHAVFGEVLLEAGREDEAYTHFELIETLVRRYPEVHEPDTGAWAWVGLGEIERRRGNLDGAKTYLERAMNALETNGSDDELTRARAKLRLARCIERSAPDRARTLAAAAITGFQESFDAGDTHLRPALETARTLAKE